jgi:NADH:ubiquinone oxidoreductase subunit 2 (subunit N)
MVNAAIAVYYYLGVVREAWFRDPGDVAPIKLDWGTRIACVVLIGGILVMGIAPGRVMETISTSVAKAKVTLPMAGGAVAVEARK